jgi:hypothetical protein
MVKNNVDAYKGGEERAVENWVRLLTEAIERGTPVHCLIARGKKLCI